MKKIILTACLSVIATFSYANIENLQQHVDHQYPQLAIKNIQPTEMQGLYSASVEDQLVFLTADGEHLLLGNAIRLKDQRNITKELSLQQNKLNWKELPLKDAIKEVRGTGKREIAIFSDPNCPYCKKLEDELNKLNDVTIYTFILPLKIESIVPSKQVFCEAKPLVAWKNLISHDIQAKTKKACNNPIQRNIDLAKKLGLNGTPAIIFSNGSKVMGAHPATEIEKIWTILGL